MSGWDELQSFEPTGLRTALAEIERQHAHLIDPPDPLPDRIERLRELLNDTSVGEVEALASTLERQDLIAVADLLASDTDPELVSKAVLLGSAARLEALIRRAWRLAVRIHPSAGLARLLLSGVEQGLIVAVSTEEPAGRISPWFENDDLPLSLLRDLEDHAVSPDEWLDTQPALTTAIDASSVLFEAMRCRLLTHGAKSTLKKHEEDLLGWLAELTAEGRAALREDFAVNYVLELRPEKAWSEDIADWITESFGEPDPVAPRDMWRRLDRASRGVVGEFSSWLALRKLEEFFAEVRDPHGRFEFWRENFAEYLKHVELVANRQAALLCLGPLVVIEFAEIGNAAYVYPESDLGWLQRVRSADVGSYKRRERLVRRTSGHGEFRILHFQGWQERERNEISAFLDRSKR